MRLPGRNGRWCRMRQVVALSLLLLAAAVPARAGGDEAPPQAPGAPTTPRADVFPLKEETDTGFEFLWSRTFEDDEDWNELRRRARRCFTALRRDGDPVVG